MIEMLSKFAVQGLGGLSDAGVVLGVGRVTGGRCVGVRLAGGWFVLDGSLLEFKGGP